MVSPLLTSLASLPGMAELAAALTDRLDAATSVPRAELRRNEEVDREWANAKRKFLAAKVVDNALGDLVIDYTVREAEDGGCIASQEKKVRAI